VRFRKGLNGGWELGKMVSSIEGKRGKKKRGYLGIR